MQSFAVAYSLTNILAAILCAAIAILAPQRKAKTDWNFRIFVAMTSYWCLTSGLFFLNTTLQDFWVWTGLQTIAYVTIPVLWFLFVLSYTGHRCPYAIFLFVIPSASLTIFWHQDLSSLMWTITGPDWSLGIPIANFERGLWFKHVHIPYSYGLMLLGFGVLIRAFFQNPKPQQRPLLLILCCGLIPFVLNLATLSFVFSFLQFFDLTPIGLAISSLLFYWGLSHFHLLQRSPLAYQSIYESLQASILILDLDFKLIEFNGAATDMLGLSPKSIDQPIDQLLSFINQKEFKSLVDGCTFEIFNYNRYLKLEQHPIKRQEILIGYILSITDVTESRKLQEQILQGALLYDALTGLPNRTLFVDRLEKATQRLDRETHSQFAVLFIDLDRFKIVNDSLGHSAGDHLLVEIAHRLQSCLRPQDTVARFGGDEFAILVENTYPPDIQSLCQRLQRQIQAPVKFEEHPIHSNASIGISFGYQGANPEQLIRNADFAMYQAKGNHNGGYVLYDQTLHNQAVQTMQLELDLHHALESHQFYLVYQPIVEMTRGITTGFEALLRWNHPHHGPVFPTVFIPIAEEMGLITSLDQWALNRACHQLKALNTQFPSHHFTISVNLSSLNFISTNLCDILADMIESTGISGTQLKLEITETILMESSKLTAPVLTQLQDLGVTVQLDDFGTGHSSLSYLHDLPLDALKIDRSFIQQAEHNPQSPEIIKTIISLAQGLNLKVIGEGIETHGQYQLLLNLGCNLGQGFFWSEPFPANNIPNWVSRM